MTRVIGGAFGHIAVFFPGPVVNSLMADLEGEEGRERKELFGALFTFYTMHLRKGGDLTAMCLLSSSLFLQEKLQDLH